jgi:exodeoxyribonuclease-3
MFTLEERQQLGKIVGLGFVDSFRHLHPQEKRYTWLSYLKSAREKNLGWRLDYIFTSQSLRRFLTDAFIIPYPAASDHCPVGVTISPPCLAS